MRSSASARETTQDTAGLGSFSRSMRPLLRKRTSRACRRSQSSSSEGCQASPGVSMKTMGLPFSSSVTSRACGVVVGELADREDAAYTSSVALRAREFMNALFPDYTTPTLSSEGRERTGAYIRKAYDGDVQWPVARLLLGPGLQQLRCCIIAPCIV